MIMKCSITGRTYEQDINRDYPQVDPLLAMLFENLVQNAASYHTMTGRYLQIWGELGELYAEVKYGIKRHRPHTKGSDGKLGNDYVEVKTISPEKDGAQVQVRRSGNFSKLLVIKIDARFRFEGRFIDRKSLSKGTSTFARVSWSTLAPEQ
jgi:hypothetical protein